MASAPSEAAAISAPAAGEAGQQLERSAGGGAARRGELAATGAAPLAADAAPIEPDDPASADDVEPEDVFLGRPDLAQDTIEELRSKHRALKTEQKKVRAQLKNQAKKRTRIMKKMRHIDTATVLQMLMERGVDFRAPAAAAAPARAPLAGEAPAPAAASSARSSSG